MEKSEHKWVLVFRNGPNKVLQEEVVIWASSPERAALYLDGALRFRTREHAELWSAKYGLTHFTAEEADG